MTKTGVLLVNLGTPDSPSVRDVRAYLAPFLMDRFVLDVPGWLRALLVYGIILPTRPKRSAHAYQSIWTEAGSPLMVYTMAFGKALSEMNPQYSMEVAMRYGNPSIQVGVSALLDKGCDRLVVVPLYPQYAMSTVTTVTVMIREVVDALKVGVPVHVMPPFYHQGLYQDALAESIKPHMDGVDYLLFSYHGIPVRHLKKTDPTHSHCQKVTNCCESPSPAHATCYRHQCMKTTQAVVGRLGLLGTQYGVSFQSRLGRDPWLEPYTEPTVMQLAKRGVKRLGVVCPAFVSDCLETLEEIGEEVRGVFIKNGGESFTLIPCLNDQVGWVEAFSSLLNGYVGELPN